MKKLLFFLLSVGWAEQPAPEFIEHPRDVFIGKENAAEIRCEAKFATQLQFRCNDDWFTTKSSPHQWADDDGVKHVSSSATIKKSKVLEFLAAGPFTCSCVAYGDASGTPVHSKAASIQIAYLKSDFEEEPHNENKLVGESIEINCVAPAGAPKPRVSWLKDGQLLDPDEEGNIMIDYKGSLVIRVARLKDSGKYTCMAENIIATRRSQPAKIDVYINGMWGSWEPWTECPVNEHSCIKEMKHRRRSCDSPAPTGESAQQCVGRSEEESDCLSTCVIDGGWSSWEPWTPCSEGVDPLIATFIVLI